MQHSVVNILQVRVTTVDDDPETNQTGGAVQKLVSYGFGQINTQENSTQGVILYTGMFTSVRISINHYYCPDPTSR